MTGVPPERSPELPTTPATDCWTSHFRVYFDDLDLNGHVHNARLVAFVERAQTELFEALGHARSDPTERAGDLRYVVRELRIEFLAPVAATGPLDIALSADRLGTTSATYGFRCLHPGQDTVMASGHRTIVKVGPDGRPTAWSPEYRETFASLAAGTHPSPAGPPQTGPQ